MCNVEEKYKNYVFDFENLEVYKMALKFITKVFKTYRKLPREYRYSIGDQFTRSALSIANNIAEGSGKESKKGKSQFYNIALNSGRECIPMITLLLTEQQITEEEYADLRSDCIHICNMLGKLVRVLK
ncbi:MAG: four helix bundle protein [Elusimicrobia bacterium HGW-Elusimicrobia-4]|nr:MAG: four helix bundle protein [Elusimicrobia bacterium HGW-Elusimicrobia-4]